MELEKEKEKEKPKENKKGVSFGPITISNGNGPANLSQPLVSASPISGKGADQEGINWPDWDDIPQVQVQVQTQTKPQSQIQTQHQSQTQSQSQGQLGADSLESKQLVAEIEIAEEKQPLFKPYKILADQGLGQVQGQSQSQEDRRMTQNEIETVLLEITKVAEKKKSLVRAVGHPVVVCVLITADLQFFSASNLNPAPSLGFWDLAESKAWTSLTLSSDKFSVSSARASIFSGYSTAVQKGGLPIYNKNNVLVGALGVAGDSPIVDEAICEQTISAAGFAFRSSVECIDINSNTIIKFSKVKYRNDSNNQYKIVRLRFNPNIGFVYDKSKKDSTFRFCRCIFYDVTKLEKWAATAESAQNPCPLCYFSK